jgi:predicted transposase/invertase (TIGR01784 family)
MLANLDNEVIFKKAFTDKIVFEEFVKDVVGIDFTVGTIETEKRFSPKLAYVDFKLDIFAESLDERVIIEIQKIEYDHNFDRFLHYFLMALAELQRNAKEYKIGKTVYTIIVLTAPYKVLDKMGNVIKNEVLITELNPKNLKGDVIQLYGHKLIFLNIYYKDDDPPQPLRDWMDLIRESINNPNNPNINLQKVGIQRANFLIDIDNLTPREREKQKLAETAKVALKVYEAAANAEGMAKGIEMGVKKAKDDSILKALKRGKLSVVEIAEDNEVTVDYVLAIQKEVK